MVAPHASSAQMRTPSHSIVKKVGAVLVSVALSALLLPTGSAFAATSSKSYGTIAGVSSIMFAPDATAQFKTPSKATDRIGYVNENAIGVEEVVGSMLAEDPAYSDIATPVAANTTGTAGVDAAAVNSDGTAAPDAGIETLSSDIPVEGDGLAASVPTVVITPVATYDELMASLGDKDTNIMVMDEIVITSVLTLDYDVIIDMEEGSLVFKGPDAHIEVVDDAYVTFIDGSIEGDNLTVLESLEVLADEGTPVEDAAIDEEAPADGEAPADEAGIMMLAGLDDDAAEPEPADEALIDVIDSAVVLNGTEVTVGENAAVGIRGTESSTIRLIEGTALTYEGTGVALETDGSLVLNSSSIIAKGKGTALSISAVAVVSADAYSEITSVGGTAVSIESDVPSDSVSFNCVGKITGVTPIVFGNNVTISNSTFPFKIDSAYLSDNVLFLIVLDNNFLYTSAAKDVVMSTAPTGSKIYPVIRGMVNWSNETLIEPPVTETTTTNTNTEQSNQQDNWSQLEVVTPRPSSTTTTNTAAPNTPLNSTAVATTVAPVATTTTTGTTLSSGMAPIAQYLSDDATPLAQGLMNSGAVFGSFEDPEGTDILATSSSPLRGTKAAVGTYAYSQPQSGLSWLPFVIGGVVLLVGGAVAIYLVYRHQQTAALVALLDEDEDDYYFSDMETPEDLEMFDDMEYDPYDL